LTRSILIVTNSRDFGTDAVIEALTALGSSYLRLDLDLLFEDEVFLDPFVPLLRHTFPGGASREITNPTAVFFRAPTHLRESSGHRHQPDDLLRNHQWAAFARSLTVFTAARWVNHPMFTYAAENKPFQLAMAASLGFAIPPTSVANFLPGSMASDDRIAVKALDSFLVRRQNQDLFFYTTALRPDEITSETASAMPLIFQKYLEPKIDVRVTVVGQQCFVAETPGEVSGDWRLQKDRLKFRRADCSERLRSMCLSLMERLNLRYGAIDFAKSQSECWFLEINPTGEWAWLDELFEGEISKAIAHELSIG
jgi:glutathione synthase/RimK-type ligase-like ATP-grasp enzyme